MSIYYVRHGKTSWNAQCKLQGRSDIELDEDGIKQAYQTAALLKDIHIDKIYCSPLKRAIQTANIINEVCNAEFVLEPALLERCFGEFEGLNLQEHKVYIWSFEENLCEHAETMQDFFTRVQSFVESVKKEACEKNVLFVAHGGVYLPIHEYFYGLNRKDDLMKYVPENCTVTTFTFPGNVCHS